MERRATAVEPGSAAAAAAAAHRGQERSDLIGSQRLVTDAAVVVVLKSDAE